jgi:hypothetical protein
VGVDGRDGYSLGVAVLKAVGLYVAGTAWLWTATGAARPTARSDTVGLEMEAAY